jgi:hypothetical protein
MHRILCIGLRKTLVDDLKVVKGKEDWGLFIDSCFTHCQTPFRISWDSPISPRLENKVLCTSSLSATCYIGILICLFVLPSRRSQSLLEIGTSAEAKKQNISTASIHATLHAAPCCLHNLGTPNNELHWDSNSCLLTRIYHILAKCSCTAVPDLCRAMQVIWRLAQSKETKVSE